MVCPVCERVGRACTYCVASCPGTPDPFCACVCHGADVEREAQIKAERVARIKL